ncbi:MAG: ghrA [Burkholderiaceae bacterium]|nr:ghrA [Burkholderiaceae bacterium]
MNGLILSKDAQTYLNLSRAQQTNFVVHHASTSAEALQLSNDALARVHWLLAEPALAIEVLDQLPNLRWLQSTWAGVERLLAHPRRDYILTNIRGVFAPLISEYVLAHILAHERQLSAHREAQKNRVWFNDHTGAHVGTLRGKTMLILGIGSIGAGVAQTMRCLGMRVFGVVSQIRHIPECDAVGTMGDLPALLSHADYVVNTLPNTPATQSIIDINFLQQMKNTAILINVGRGQAVVENDLVHALHTHQIAGAVLDVYRTEPLPPEHVFWDAPNLTLTSHTAAPSFPADVFKIFWHNYQRFNAQHALSHVVDFSKGY